MGCSGSCNSFVQNNPGTSLFHPLLSSFLSLHLFSILPLLSLVLIFSLRCFRRSVLGHQLIQSLPTLFWWFYLYYYWLCCLFRPIYVWYAPPFSSLLFLLFLSSWVSSVGVGCGSGDSYCTGNKQCYNPRYLYKQITNNQEQNKTKQMDKRETEY